MCGLVGINREIVVDNFTFLPMSDEDMEQEIRDWEETRADRDVNLKDWSFEEHYDAATATHGIYV